MEFPGAAQEGQGGLRVPLGEFDRAARVRDERLPHAAPRFACDRLELVACDARFLEFVCGEQDLNERRQQRDSPERRVASGGGRRIIVTAVSRRPWVSRDRLTHAPILGTIFDGRILHETTVGGRRAMLPAIRGSAWIAGITQVLVDPTDPFPEGYLLTDTWPRSDIQNSSQMH